MPDRDASRGEQAEVRCLTEAVFVDGQQKSEAEIDREIAVTEVLKSILSAFLGSKEVRANLLNGELSVARLT